MIIREGPADQAQLGPGSEVMGPIEQEEVAVSGQPAILYSSSEGNDQWLVFTREGTAIELHPMPMSEEEGEINPFNNTEALVALAEALAPVPDEP